MGQPILLPRPASLPLKNCSQEDSPINLIGVNISVSEPISHRTQAKLDVRFLQVHP